MRLILAAVFCLLSWPVLAQGADTLSCAVSEMTYPEAERSAFEAKREKLRRATEA